MLDESARVEFDDLLRRTQSQIRAYIAGMGIPPHEVDDVGQEVYLELYRNFHKVPADVAPERWLKGIAKNLCLNHIRRTARRGRLHREALAEILTRTETRADRLAGHSSVGLALAECCGKLPDRSRRMLAMRYEDAMPSAAIAAAMNATAEAVRIALFRIRALLRDCIVRTLAEES